MQKKHLMKTLILFLAVLTSAFSVNAQQKATPPYAPEQYVQNILHEIDIPDATFDKMRGKDYVVRLKLFLDEKGAVVKTTVSNDEFQLSDLIFNVVKQLPNFSPAMADGVAKASLYNLPFVINEYNYYKLVRNKAVPAVGMEKFVNRVRNNFYLTDVERIKLSAAKTKEHYDVVIDFIVEKDGSLSAFRMGNEEMEYFKDRMIKAVKSASKKWIPASVNGQPVRSKHTYTLTLKVDFHSLNI